MDRRYEFTYQDSTRRQRWQTAKGNTKGDTKAERAEMVARLHRGERVERSSRTVGEVAEAMRTCRPCKVAGPSGHFDWAWLVQVIPSELPD